MPLLHFASVLSSTAPPYATSKDRPPHRIVQLRYASLPQPLTAVAVHYWFAVYDPRGARWHRWEVWQDPDLRDAAGHWGHVHLDLGGVNRGVGGGDFVIEREWQGTEAERIADALASTPTVYPYRASYWPWPGPNSNTFAAWVLHEAKVAADLHPKAIGKDYLGVGGASVTTTRSGLQLETPLVGLKVGARDGVELHVICLTLGLDVWPPAFKTPFGRIGFAE